MRPKKRLIERAIENGSIKKLNMMMSAVHILNCEANNIVSEAGEIMKENGLLLGVLKQKHTRFMEAADAYFREFSSMVDTEEAKMDMFHDMESFGKAFRKWAKLDEDYNQIKDESDE